MNKSIQDSSLRAVLNIIGFIGVVIVNGLANSLPLNNRSTGVLSDLYPNLFVPEGLTFSIWGVIYILLAIYAVYQLIAVLKKISQGTKTEGQIGYWFLISCAANIGWIFAWHFEQVLLSVLLMLVLLGSLLKIYINLDIGKSKLKGISKLSFHIPFSVYLGWITIATIANITALLVNSGWRRFGLSHQFWAVLVIAVGVVITMLLLYRKRDIFYALVVEWALLGIVLKRVRVDLIPDTGVLVAGIAGMALVCLGILYTVFRKG
jgi:hypothetical protein